jgi:phospholipid/cholesterol/gamma-HCH transport system permease protein
MSDEPTNPGMQALPPSEPQPLVDLVQQELESIIPLTARIREAITELGSVVVLSVRTLKLALTPPFGLKDIAYQIEMLGVRSLSLGALVAVFAGLVISLQFAFFMQRFGIQHTVGKVVVLTLFRELAPVLTALTVGARIGSGITAELGSMKVTEQIDAIRAMGADPVKKLVAPRVIACMLVVPALTALADCLGLVAGSAVVWSQFEIGFNDFYRSVVDTATIRDFTSGVGKSFIFGFIIAVVGCHKGFQTGGGTEGVGKATTETVAIASVAVLLSDFFLTKLLMAL